MSEIDPFFNPNVAQHWPAPIGEPNLVMPAPAAELQDDASPYLQELRSRRQEYIKENSLSQAKGALYRATPDSPNSLIYINERDETAEPFPYETSLTIEAASNLASVGLLEKALDTELDGSFSYKPEGAEEPITFEKIGDYYLRTRASSNQDLRALGNEVSKIRADNELSQIASTLLKRHSYEANGDVSDNTFRLGKDMLGNVSELAKLGFFRGSLLTPAGVAELSPDELDVELRRIVNGRLRELDLIAGEHEGEFTAIKNDAHNNGVEILLVAEDPFTEETDLTEVEFRLGWSVDKTKILKETADQDPSSKSDSLLERQFGTELLQTVDESGLKFSHEFEQFLVERRVSGGEFDERYGGEYTVISREIAKAIHKGDITQLETLFTLGSDENGGSLKDQLQRFVEIESDNEPLSVLQGLIGQLLSQQPAEGSAEVPVMTPTEGEVRIKDGACFDVMSYYLGSIDYPGGLNVKDVEGAIFLEKTHGSHTFMNMEPVSIKGVSIPAGGLFSKGKDGGMAFLRLTPFVMKSREAAIDAFGTEVIKGEQNGRLGFAYGKAALQSIANHTS